MLVLSKWKKCGGGREAGSASAHVQGGFVGLWHSQGLGVVGFGVVVVAQVHGFAVVGFGVVLQIQGLAVVGFGVVTQLQGLVGFGVVDGTHLACSSWHFVSHSCRFRSHSLNLLLLPLHAAASF